MIKYLFLEFIFIRGNKDWERLALKGQEKLVHNYQLLKIINI